MKSLGTIGRLVRSSAFLLCAFVSQASAQPHFVTERGLLPGDGNAGIAVNTQQEQSVARGGDQFLVAWTDLRGQAAGGGTNQSAADVFGIRLDAQGNPIETIPFMIAGGMGNQQRPLVAWNGQAWLVVFISQDPVGGYYEDRMRAVRVSPQGEVLDATPIVFPPTQFTPNTIGLHVAGQGGQWLITRCIYHDDGYGTKLVGQRIANDGTLLDTTPVLLIDWIYGGTKTLAANGEYLVAGPDWSNGGIIKARRVGLDGQPFGAPFNVPSLTLATNGTEHYVTWMKDYVNLVGSRMTLAGNLVNPAGTTIVGNISQYTHSTLEHDGAQWWVEWGHSDVLRTVRIDAAGNVLDPGGGVLLPIDIGGNVDTAYSPMLVRAVGGGVHLFWYDLRQTLGNDANVFRLPISAQNVAGTEACVSTGTRNQRIPDFAEGPGGQVAVTFVSEVANDARVLVHLLTATGLPLAQEPIEVAAASGIGKPGIAWNGSLYMVTWDDASGIKARRMNADGSFVDPAPVAVMPGFSPDVEALGEDFLVACARFNQYPEFIDAWMRIVDGPTGGFQNAATMIGAGYVNVGPRVRQDGGRWIVTYHSHWTHDSSQSDAVYNFVAPDGSFTPAANPSQYSGSAGTPDVAFSGQKYLFVWRNNSLANANNYIAGRIMNANGTFATANFTIAEAPGRQLRPVVAWDGTTFVVAWDDQRNQESFFDARTDVYAARVSEAGTVLDPTAFPVYVGPQGDATAAILARNGGTSLVASARFQTRAPHDTYRIGVTVLSAGPLAAVPGDEAADDAARPDLRNAPNPFLGHTSIEVELQRAETVDLLIHDIEGRVVRTLLRGAAVSAGRHAVDWDGRDDSGTSLPGGLYFARLRTPTATRDGRLLLAR